MPVPLRVLRPTRALAREEVYARLHEWIVDGTLKPGEHLREQELAEVLGVSRTPIREALLLLEESGLVETQPNRGTHVTQLDINDVKHIYPILELLEPMAVRLLEGRIGEAEFQALERANADIEKAVEGRIAGGAAWADEQFHRLIGGRCGNPELERIIADLRVKLRRMANAYFYGRVIAERSVIEHAAVIEAMRAGDFERAAQASAAHWRGSLERFLEHVG